MATEPVNVALDDVLVHAKYNAVLVQKPHSLGVDQHCRDLVNRGLELMEVRSMIQRDLIDTKNDRCSDLFRMRNTKASDCKLGVIDRCSYCGEKMEPTRLQTYFTLAHVDDILVKEIAKRKDEKTRHQCVFQYIPAWSLETKMRDVRSHESVTLNQGCALFCLTRCDKCLQKPGMPPGVKIEEL